MKVDCFRGIWINGYVIGKLVYDFESFEILPCDAAETDARIVVRDNPLSPSPQVKSGKDFARLFSDYGSSAQEAFFLVTMDQKHKVIDKHLISLGTQTASLVDPKIIFSAALRDSAVAIAFVHNHPSGDTTPSGEDRALTARLQKGAELLGFRVLDHVIIGRDGDYFSFVDFGIF